MKKFTIEVKGASSAQLLTIAAELKIMSHGWAKFGPRIMINKRALEAPDLHIPVHKYKAQATHKRHNSEV